MTTQEMLKLEKLAQLRDELRVKAHLAGAELRSQWEELENKWVLLQSRLSSVRKAGSDSAKEIRAAVDLLVKELAEGYERMREAFANLR